MIAALLLLFNQSVPDDWESVEGAEFSSSFMQLLASNDLILVVLGVSLIIWFTLLFFVIRLDRKVSYLEQQTLENDTDK